MIAPTGGFLALEVSDQLGDLIDVVETLQLTLVVNDLHRVFNHLCTDGKVLRCTCGVCHSQHSCIGLPVL